MCTNGVYTSIIGTKGSASCKSGPDEVYKQYSILHGDNGANAQTRLELLYNICRCSRRSGGNDDEGCKSKCMRPLEVNCTSNCAGTLYLASWSPPAYKRVYMGVSVYTCTDVGCSSVSGPSYMYVYRRPVLTVLIKRTHTHRDYQIDRQTHTHGISHYELYVALSDCIIYPKLILFLPVKQIHLSRQFTMHRR